MHLVSKLFDGTFAFHPLFQKFNVRVVDNKHPSTKDEFIDNGNWPHQLYIREVRRMVGAYVTTENEVLGKVNALDPNRKIITFEVSLYGEIVFEPVQEDRQAPTYFRHFYLQTRLNQMSYAGRQALVHC